MTFAREGMLILFTAVLASKHLIPSTSASLGGLALSYQSPKGSTLCREKELKIQTKRGQGTGKFMLIYVV